MTEQDRIRIREEEIFRAEIQMNLKKSKSSNKIWKFFNSAFGLWMLSSIVLSFLTFSYQAITNHYETTYSNKIEIEKLNIEISKRLKFFNKEISRVSDYLIKNEDVEGLKKNEKEELAKKQYEFIDRYTSALRSLNENKANVFLAYQFRSLTALLLDLHGIESDKNKIIIEKCLLDCIKIEEKIGYINSGTNYKEAETSFYEVNTYLKNCLSPDFWEQRSK